MLGLILTRLLSKILDQVDLLYSKRRNHDILNAHHFECMSGRFSPPSISFFFGIFTCYQVVAAPDKLIDFVLQAFNHFSVYCWNDKSYMVYLG